MAVPSAGRSARVSLIEAVDAYLREVRRVRTENVVTNHVSMSRRFLSYFSAQRRRTFLADLRREDLLAFLDWLTHRRGRFTAHTYNLGVEYIKRLARFALAQGWLEENPAETIAYPEIPATVPEVLSPEELARLLEVARADEFHYILVVFLGQLGLKKQELLALRLADLEVEGPAPGVVVRYGGKLRSKSRRLPLPPEAAQAVQRYLIRRQAGGALGLPERLVPITGRQVNNIIVKLCKQAGIRRANPQILRDTAAVQLLLAGRPPDEVGQFLGYTPRGYLLEFLPRFRTWIGPLGE